MVKLLHIGLLAIIAVVALLGSIVPLPLSNSGTKSGNTTTAITSTSSSITTSTVCSVLSLSGCPTTSIPTTTIQSGGNNEVTMNLLTWTGGGASQIDLQAISDIQVFHVYPTDTSCDLTFDGNDVNVAQEVAQAHAAGDIVTIAFGGAGLNENMMNTILGSSSDMQNCANNLAAIDKQYGVDGNEIDLEENYYSETGVTQLTIDIAKAVRAYDANAQINFVTAGWLFGIDNFTAINPYITHYHCGFWEPQSNAGGCGQSTVQQLASMLGSSRNKISVGFYLPDENPTMLAQNLTWARNNGYGVYFWEASSAASENLYPTIASYG